MYVCICLKIRQMNMKIIFCNMFIFKGLLLIANINMCISHFNVFLR